MGTSTIILNTVTSPPKYKVFSLKDSIFGGGTSTTVVVNHYSMVGGIYNWLLKKCLCSSIGHQCSSLATELTLF